MAALAWIIALIVVGGATALFLWLIVAGTKSWLDERNGAREQRGFEVYPTGPSPVSTRKEDEHG